MNNPQIKAKIAQFRTAIKVTKRLGVKPPAALVVSVTVLERVVEWRQKKALAETKLKKYERIWKRYERRMAKGEQL